jgi:hypothetical protein
MIVAIVLALAAIPALAAEGLHPPYPDVWGREVPGIVRFFAAPADDVMIVYSVLQPTQRSEGEEFWLEGFFSGTRRQSTHSEFQSIYNADASSSRNLGTFAGKGRIGFSDGSVISVEELFHHEDNQWTCRIAAPMIVKRDATGKVIWRKVIVRLLSQPVAARADQNCSDGGSRYQLKVQFIGLAYNCLYGLDDNTFLAWFNGLADDNENFDVEPGSEGARRYAIRFDANLGSPFLARQSSDVVVVDAAAVEPAIADAVKRHHPTPAEGRNYFEDKIYETLSKPLKPSHR